MRLLSQNVEGRIVYLVPKEDLAEIVFSDWSDKFGSMLGVKVVSLSGETGTDLKVFRFCSGGSYLFFFLNPRFSFDF